MQKIDMQTWPRRLHFDLYRRFDHPHFSLCANVDIGATYAAVKERGFSISTTIIYLIARLANEIPEFRYRMRGGGSGRARRRGPLTDNPDPRRPVQLLHHPVQPGFCRIRRPGGGTNGGTSGSKSCFRTSPGAMTCCS